MPTALETAIVVEALLIVWIGVRSYRSYQGRPYSSTRVLVFPVLIFLLFAVTEFETISTVPWAFPIWTAIDVAVLVAGAVVTLPIAGRLVHVERRNDGMWYYRYGVELISFYLALWIVRLALAIYYDPASIEFAPPSGVPLSATASEVLVLIQGLLALSSGLVVGRGIGTYRLAQRSAGTPVA